MRFVDDLIGGLSGRRSRVGSERVEPTILASNEIREYGTLEDLIRESVGSDLTDAGVMVSTDAAARFSAVGSCVRVLSDDLSSLPLVVYRHVGEESQPAQNLPVFRLLKSRPNEWQTAAEFRQLAERERLLRGVSYSLIVRNFRKDVDELIRMDPMKVAVKQDDRTMAVTFEYTRDDGRRVVLPRSEVFAVRYATKDGLEPLSPVSLFRETIGDGIAMRKYGGTLFSRGARPGGVLQADAKIDAESKKAMRDDWERLHSGPENQHRTAVLDQGMKYEPVALSMEDAQWIESRKFNRSEVAGIFGVPPHKIGDLDRATFTNIEHQSIEYVTGALTPNAVKWEQAIQRDLLPEGDEYYAKHKFDGLLRGDAKSRNEALQIQRRNGVINANEWRALQDMNPRPDEGGDEYIVEQNMRPNDGTQPEDPAGGTQ